MKGFKVFPGGTNFLSAKPMLMPARNPATLHEDAEGFFRLHHAMYSCRPPVFKVKSEHTVSVS